MKKLKRLETNIYTALVLRLLAVMFIFQIGRLIFYLININLFDKTTFAMATEIAYKAIPFDISAILYTNMVFILMMVIPFKFRYNNIYQKATKWVFLIFNTIAVFANSIDWVYYRYTLRRSTAIVFDEFENESNIGKIIFDGVAQNWYLSLLFIGMIVLMSYLYSSVKIKARYDVKAKIYYPLSLLSLIVAGVLFIFGVRGSFNSHDRPISIHDAFTHITNIGEEAILLNTPFSVYRTLGDNKLPEYKYFDKKKLREIYNPIHTSVNKDSMNKKNVVILIMESIGREYSEVLNKDANIENFEDYIPFIDSLMKESMYFTHAFANGKRSVEAMPSILASIPSLTEAFALSAYSQTNYSSLNRLLGDEGYESYFYHGAVNSSMGFAAFAKRIGINNYMGKDEYNDDSDHDGTWGIWDEPFMQYMLEDISKRKEPFVATLFSLTSHEPFTIPKEYDGVFKEGPWEVHKTVGYTDNALREFFKTAKTKSWYENTIFVITADHTPKPYYDFYRTIYGNFYVPIIFYTPSGELKGERTETIQHIDIMPTILEHLGYNKDYFSFGESKLYEDKENDFAINYIGNSYNIYYKDYMLNFDGSKSLALYNYKKDWQLKDNLIEKEKAILEIMETKGKAFIQTYNNSLIYDKMSIPTFTAK